MSAARSSSAALRGRRPSPTPRTWTWPRPSPTTPPWLSNWPTRGADQQRIALLEDRDRIARDLHDHVIQRLFAAGLTLDGVLGTVPRGPASRRDRLGRSTRSTRRSARSAPQSSSCAASWPRDRLRARSSCWPSSPTSARCCRPNHRSNSSVRWIPSSPDGVAEDLLAVVREALTNIRRHAAAHGVRITLSASDLPGQHRDRRQRRRPRPPHPAQRAGQPSRPRERCAAALSRSSHRSTGPLPTPEPDCDWTVPLP